jgi:DNA-binding IclR family transcriptional regulator
MTPASLPFSGSTPISRHHSAKAAEAARETRLTKTTSLLCLLRTAPRGLTDHDIVRLTGWPMSTVCSVRNGLLRANLIEARTDEHGLSPYGRTVTLWRALV